MSSDGIRSARSFAVILIVHLVVIVLWQVLVDAFHVPKFVLPSPLATVATLTSAKYAWLSNLAVTVTMPQGRSACITRSTTCLRRVRFAAGLARSLPKIADRVGVFEKKK